jgi:hypothetical protein
MKKAEHSWMQYFAWVDPDTPYLRLFRAIVEVAYVALGGDVVDQCLAAARRMDEDYQRGQVEAAALARVHDRHGTAEKRSRPVGHREGAGARRDCWKYEGGRRKRFEEACDTVRKLFRSVLGYDAILPHEPEETREHKPEDPEMIKKIEARAANLQSLYPVPSRTAARADMPVDEGMLRENVVLRHELREAHVEIQQMARTIKAMQGVIKGGLEDALGGEFTPAPEGQGEAATQTAPSAALRVEGPYLKLALGPAEPTAEMLAPYPKQDHPKIIEMWHHIQLAEKPGVSKDLLRRAALGDTQAQAQVDRMLEQVSPAGV